MCLVKSHKVGNITVNIHDDYIPKEQELYKNNLKVVYDTINIIFQDKERKQLFYTKEELEQIRIKKSHELI